MTRLATIVALAALLGMAVLGGTAQADIMLDSAVGLWQYVDVADANGPPHSDFVHDPATGMNVNQDVLGGPILALNSDQKAIDDQKAGYIYMPNIVDGHELLPTGGVTLFARVNFNSFDGVDDVFSMHREFVENFDLDHIYGLEFLNAVPQFSVHGAGVAGRVNDELNFAAPLSTNTWYDITGVFDPGVDTGDGQGAVSLYVYDPQTGSQVGATATMAVPYDALEIIPVNFWESLVFETPWNVHGVNDAQMDLTAVWDRALTQAEVAGLSAAGTVLTWDQNHTELSWDSAHWLPGGTPNASAFVVLPAGNTDVVSLNSGGTAHWLTVDDGGIDVANNQTLAIGGGADFAAGTTLSIGQNAALTSPGGNLNLATLTLGDGAMLSGGGGTIGTINAAGSATLDLGNDVTVGSISVGPGTFTKQGAGALTLDNSDGTGVTANAATEFQVAGGTLASRGGSPLGSATQLTLSGGTFSFDDGLGVPQPGPAGAIAKWTFDSVAGATVTNEGIGLGMDGTLAAGASIAGGKIGNALALDGGIDAYMDVASEVTELGAADFTLALWINTDMFMAPILTKNNPTTGWSSAEKYFYTSPGSATEGPVGAPTFVGWGADWISGTTPVTDNQWHHVAITWDVDTGTGFMYVDGLEETSYDGYNGLGDNVGESIRLGFNAFDGFNNYNGLMDEVYIYDRTLEATEVGPMFALRTAPNMASVNVTVTADSTLHGATTAENTSFAGLTMQQGILSTTGSGSISFAAGTNVPPGTTGLIGFDPQTTTDYGAIDIGGSDVTIAKAGPSTWVLDSVAGNAPSNLGAAADWDVQGGQMTILGTNVLSGKPVTVSGGTLLTSGEAPLGASTVTLSGGTLEVIGTGEPTGPVAKWTFDNVAGATVVNDGIGGPSMDGILAAGASIGAGTGQVGDALVLNGGIDAYMDVASGVTEFGGANFTMALWIQTEMFLAPMLTKSNLDAVWSHAEKTFYTSPAWSAQEGPVGAPTYVGYGADWITGTTPVTDNQWHHLTVTWDNDTGQGVMYVDGVEETSYLGYNGLVDNPNDLVRLGFSAFNTANYMGQMDEVYVYDRALHAIEVDRLFADGGAPAAGADADMSAVDLLVTADSSVVASGAAGIPFGALSIDDGVLTTQGTDGLNFTSTTIDSGASAAGFDTQANTNPGAITASGVTIIKRGPADLILDSAAGDLSGATFDVQEGRLIGVHNSNPFGTATLQLAGGEVVLSSGAGDVLFDNAVHVTEDGSLLAGAAAGGLPGPLTITLGSTPANGVAIDPGKTLTLSATDDYALDVAGAIDGAEGSVTVSEGVVSLAGGSLSSVKVTGGTLNTTDDLIVDVIRLTEGTLNTNAAQVIVSEEMKLGTTSLSISEGNSFTASGPDLRNGGDITVGGGTLTIGVPGAPTGAVAYWSFDNLDAVTVLNQGAGGADMNGTLVNGATVGAGKNGNALLLDGVGYMDTTSGVTEFGAADFSLSLWVNTTMLHAPMVSKNDPNTPWAYAEKTFYTSWGTYGPEGPTGAPSFVGWGADYLSGTTSVADNQWHHVTYTWDYDTLTGYVYVDGNEETSYGQFNGLADNPGEFLRLGFKAFDWLPTNFIGMLDEVYVYDRTLPANEVDNLYGDGSGVVAQPIDLSDTNLHVTSDSLLQLESYEDVMFGDLTVADGVNLGVNQAGALSVASLNLGDGAQLGSVADLANPHPASLFVRGMINIGSSPGTATIVGELELAEEADDGGDTQAGFHVDISGDLNDKLVMDGDGTIFGASGLAWIAGTLEVEGQKPMTSGGSPIWGDQVLTVMQATPIVEEDGGFKGEFGPSSPGGSIPLSYGVAGTLPNEGDYLGAGLWFGNAGNDGVYYPGRDNAPNPSPEIAATAVQIGVFQAAPGDTDGNRKVEGQDILNILQAGLFGDGVTTEANWGNGDFNADSKISGEDILALLGTGLFGDGTYPDSAASAAGADVKLVVTGGGLVIDTGGATLTGFVLSSESGILTGDDADNLGLFQEDTDATISGTFAMSLKGEHGLGDVLGDTDVDLGGDLTLAYTIAGIPGVFTASVVVPEPGTLMLLLSGLAGLLIWRRRM